MNNKLLYSRIEGTGFPIVILHGFFGMSDNWKSIGSVLASKDYQVHLLDLRNHGRSFHDNAFSYDVMVEDIYHYILHHNIDSCHVIGHSMGGKVAMQLACQYPNVVDKLIVADIGPKYYAPHHQVILEALNSVDFSNKPSRNDVQEQLSKYIKEQGVLQFLLKNLYRKNQDELDFRFNLPVLTQKVEEVGKALPKELYYEALTLFLYGKNSNYIKQEDVPFILEQFPKAIFRGIDNAGHWLHAEQSEAFLEATLLFLKTKL